MAEIQGIIQRLQYDLLTLTNRMNNIEAKVLLKTNVADDVYVGLGNFTIPNGFVGNHRDNQITTHIGALSTEIAKISQRLEHLENSVYNKTSNDIIKPEPSIESE